MSEHRRVADTLPRRQSVDVDVAVVGWGPVGTALAILLAQRGRTVVAMERWADAYPLPRAVHFDHEVGRILQGCGLDGLEAISEPADVYEWRTAAGVPLLRLGREGPGAAGWPLSSMFNQPALEGLLDERARRLPGVDVRRGVTVVGLDQDDDGVVLHAEADGGPTTVRARYVVGCDGANSTVRSLVGTPIHDQGYFHDWLIVDVVLDEERVFDPLNVQICDPTRPTTAVSGGPGRRRWEFMRLPGETIEELDDEAVAWRLLAPWDVHPANARLERHAVYTFQARRVERWRTGRVLLAGDAAHQMPPFAGQGLCAGLRDVANLAWKLDLVLTDQAGDVLLDTYGEERGDHVQSVIAFSMELGRVICVADEAEAARRDQAMAEGVVDGRLTDVPPLPPIAAGVIAAGTPQAGTPFVQGRVRADGGPSRFDDAVGAGWRLVAATAVALDEDLTAWFASIGGRAVHVGPGGEVEDVDGTYRDWFAAHGVAVALQRPDFHLYGTAADPADANALIASLRAALTSC